MERKLLSTLAITTLSLGSASAVGDFSIALGSGENPATLEYDISAVAAFGTDKGNPTHGHDPSEEVNLQGLELGLSLRINEYIEGFSSTTFFIDDEDKLDGEWEEGFLKVKNIDFLSGQFEVRGGRFLNRLGIQNNYHLHSWDYVDANLSTGLFLGEEGLRTEGAEVSWGKDLAQGHFMLTTSFGEALVHEHEEEEDHGGGDHDEAEETTEKSYFNGDLITIRAQLKMNQDDFNHHTLGANLAFGDNGFGEQTDIYSFDYRYQWRENGLDAGGKEWAAGLEYAIRNVEWVDEDDASIKGSAGQSSAMAFVGHRFMDNWNISARYGWIEGEEDGSFLAHERQRLSVALTHNYKLADYINGHVRLQYNHDELEEGESEDTLWLQTVIHFGRGNEVR